MTDKKRSTLVVAIPDGMSDTTALGHIANALRGYVQRLDSSQGRTGSGLSQMARDLEVFERNPALQEISDRISELGAGQHLHYHLAPGHEVFRVDGSRWITWRDPNALPAETPKGFPPERT